MLLGHVLEWMLVLWDIHLGLAQGQGKLVLVVVVVRQFLGLVGGSGGL